ncbi:hypothetical protein V8F20_008766 [Naviculisporaceae sp. PSN 640]
MSDPFKLSCICIENPNLDIRNSKGTVHTTPNQALAGDEAQLGEIHDDSPKGKYLGSLRPACGPLSDANSVPLTLYFHVGPHTGLPDTPWQDWGFSAKGSTGQTEITVVERIAQPPLLEPWSPQQITVNFKPEYAVANFPWGFAGDVTWTLSIDGKDFVSTTRLEIYSLADSLPAFYHGVVDVQFLRAMVLPARPTPSPSWTHYVVDAAFSKFGFKYETSSGRMKYAGGERRGSYDLTRWVRGIDKGNYINCYDQAGIVLIALALGPKVDAEWMYLAPFGFIFPTMLLGYPDQKCNNPIYGGRSDTSKLLVGNDDANRHGFGNHAFVRVDGKIADACAGPHYGTESLDEYLANSIQGRTPDGETDPTEKTTIAYAHASYQQPGTASQAESCTGVTALDRCDILDPDHDIKPTPYSKEVMKMARENATDVDTATYAVALDTLSHVIRDAVSASGKSSHLHHPAVFVNAEGLEVNWDISTADDDGQQQHSTEITISVCRNNDRATKTFENDSHDTILPSTSHLEKPTDRSVYGGDVCDQVMVASKAARPDGLVRWVRGNFTVSIQGGASAPVLFQTYGAAIDRAIKGFATVPGSPLEEPVVVAGKPPSEISSRTNFLIEISCDFEFEHWSYMDDNVYKNQPPETTDLMVLLRAEQNEKTIVFHMRSARDPRAHSLEFAFADKATSRVASVKIPVEVK